jgi:hypothetical protein
MPKISLVVCVHGDREPLRRLLDKSVDAYDELLVIHDGPDFEDVRALVAQYGGRFIERPRAFSQEPHLPFAFGQASHNWILRFDSDEFPSVDLKTWLVQFRRNPEPDGNVSGYYCIWPAWNGRRMITKHWPSKRLFLFHRNRVRLIGLCENAPQPDTAPRRLNLILFHQPTGRSHGLRNIFGKLRSYQARMNVAHALFGSPYDHPRWRYEGRQWLAGWQEVKEHPVLTGLWRLFVWPPRQALAMLLSGDLPRPSVFCHAGVFHAMICFEFWRLRHKQRVNE